MSRGYHPPPGARAHLAAWDDSTAGGHLPATDYGIARGEGLPRAPTSYYTYYRAITYYTRPYLVWAAREEILPAASIECDRLVRYVSWLSPLPGLPAAAAQGRLLLRCGGRCGGRAPILHLGRASSGLLTIAHACCVRPSSTSCLLWSYLLWSYLLWSYLPLYHGSGLRVRRQHLQQHL